MDLNIYDVIQGVLITDKAQKVNADQKKLVFKVHSHSNKPIIKKAVEALFDVKVDNVRVTLRKGKLKRIGKVKTVGKLEKRAFVTLKPGHSIDLFGQADSLKVASEKQSESSKGI